MNSIQRFSSTLLSFVLLTGGAWAAQSQTMRLIPSAFTGTIDTPITLGVVVTGNIGSAVGWGTISALSDPLNMSYVPDYSGTGLPYRSLEPFFDFDFTDTSATSNGLLGFNFLNSSPGATYGFSGTATLAEFQVLLNANTPSNTLLTISLAPLGIPPLGSAVQDENGNNLLQPTDPNAPLDNVATAYLIVNSGADWVISLTPPATVPEPAGWLGLLAGTTGGAVLLRRRSRAL
jgi:hypothetical protein